MTSEPDGFGLDKDERLAAKRKATFEAQKKRVRLNPPFPFLVKPPNLDFFAFPTNPEPVKPPEA